MNIMTNKEFSECFWDCDIDSRNGFNELDAKLKSSQNACKHFILFLKERCKIEDVYVDSFRKILKNFNIHEEQGTLKESFETLKIESENICVHHENASMSLKFSADRIEELYNNLKKNRTIEKDRHDSFYKRKVDCYKSVLKSRDDYHKKCLLKDQCIENKSRSENLTNPKEKQKIYEKCDKAEFDEEKAEKCYKDCILQLEHAISVWEKEFRGISMEIFDIEQDKVKVIRNEIWAYTNIDSLKYLSADKNYDIIRNKLLHCSEVADIKQFAEVASNSHNDKPPRPLVFEIPSYRRQNQSRQNEYQYNLPNKQYNHQQLQPSQYSSLPTNNLTNNSVRGASIVRRQNVRRPAYENTQVQRDNQSSLKETKNYYL